MKLRTIKHRPRELGRWYGLLQYDKGCQRGRHARRQRKGRPGRNVVLLHMGTIGGRA